MAKKPLAPFRTSVELDTENMTVNVEIIERKTDEVVDSEIFQAAEIHDSCKQKVSLYGYSKLLQDRASDAGLEDAHTKLTAMRDVAAQLAAGQWAKERKIGAVVTSPAVEALAQLQQISVPAAQAALKAYPKEVRDQILAHEDVVKLADEIAAARLEAEVPALDKFLPPVETVVAAEAPAAA